MSQNKVFDHLGREVTVEETPDTVITVWEIEPSLDNTCDCSVIRGYQDAVECAKLVVEDVMDDQEFPATISIRQAQMTLGEYEDLVND